MKYALTPVAAGNVPATIHGNTGVPPFDAAKDDVVLALSSVLDGRPPIETRAVDDAWFGRRREVRVTELDRVDEIDALHRAFLAALEEAGVDVRAMRHVGDRFRPHVSEQRGRRLDVGATVRLAAVSLVAMRPDGDARRRRVVRTWPLGGSATP